MTSELEYHKNTLSHTHSEKKFAHKFYIVRFLVKTTSLKYYPTYVETHVSVKGGNNYRSVVCHDHI
jgi:hypothetical protein